MFFIYILLFVLGLYLHMGTFYWPLCCAALVLHAIVCFTK